MPHPKLYLYKGRDANTVTILRRGTKRTDWQLILWDLKTDTFTPGQWLKNAVICGKQCEISPDGKFFAYKYSTYKPQFADFGVVSRVPYFTALYFNQEFSRNHTYFAEDGSVVLSGTSWIKRRDDPELRVTPYIPKYEAIHIPRQLPSYQCINPMTYLPSGFIDTDVRSSSGWTDEKGRKITTADALLFADGGLLYDSTANTFTPVVAV